tara:strand:+ start:134 stop:493 length:360 start_codon:yes stop_codon:yes gene_type:complete
MLTEIGLAFSAGASASSPSPALVDTVALASVEVTVALSEVSDSAIATDEVNSTAALAIAAMSLRSAKRGLSNVDFRNCGSLVSELISRHDLAAGSEVRGVAFTYICKRLSRQQFSDSQL